jgi:hypothetical protein
MISTRGSSIAKRLDGMWILYMYSAGTTISRRVFTETHPSMFLEDGVNVKYAADQKHVKTPLATVGRPDRPAQMRRSSLP